MQSLSIGRYRGIDLRVHPTFALVGLWVLYEFGLNGDGGASLLYGFVLIGLIFGCVLLHELGHSMMAQEYGIRVRNITLFPFGGAAFIEQMPMRPRSEVMITIAGPAVNAAIATALLPLLLLYGVFNGYDSLGDYVAELDRITAGGILIYLFFANLMIALFNMLPAFPMDGGRLLRAGLSTVFGRNRATGIAVAIGFLLALLMAGLGIWFREFSLLLIAVFIVITAYGEGKSVQLEAAMRRLRVGQFALWDSGGISVHHPIAVALRGGPRDMVVTDGGRVVGMLWRRDVLQALNGGSHQRTVGDVMDEEVFAVDIDDSVYDVQRQMQATNRWAVPVTEGNHYRGIFTVDRFVHVYRHLNAQSPQRRRVASLAATLGNALRGGAR